MGAKSVMRLARMQRDLMIVSSLEEKEEREEEMVDVSRRSCLTSSSVLLALHSPLLASLLHPGADGLSLPFSLPTLSSLLAWLHGEVDTMVGEVEEAAEWLGIHINRPAERPQKPPQITSSNNQEHHGHLLPKVIVSIYNGSESEEVEEEMEEPECDREDVFFDSREQESEFRSREQESSEFRSDFEDEIKNRSTPMFSANDTFDALNFDFGYFCGEEENAKTEPEPSNLTCEQCGQFVCDQCGYRATVEEDLIEHKSAMHRCVHYSCNQCDYESARSDDLTEHMHSQHESVFIKLFASVFRN